MLRHVAVFLSGELDDRILTVFVLLQGAVQTGEAGGAASWAEAVEAIDRRRKLRTIAVRHLGAATCIVAVRVLSDTRVEHKRRAKPRGGQAMAYQDRNTLESDYVSRLIRRAWCPYSRTLP